MKKELGDCTRRLSLCFLISNSADGCSKSTSFWRTYSMNKINQIETAVVKYPVARQEFTILIAKPANR